MVVSVEAVARRYEDVSASTPISVDLPCYEATDVYVYYGKASLVAVQGTDYTVSLAGDFNTFTVTPTASLITKIDALIAADATETNFITVRRDLDYLTDATAAGVRYTPYTSREFDRNAMRDQQLADELNRSLKLGERFAAPYPDITLAEFPSDVSAEPVLVFKAAGGIGAGPTSAEVANAQANANAAAAALDEFTDIYLGAKSADPATDNDGDPLQIGAQYFNTTANVMKVYTGAAWETYVTADDLGLAIHDAPTFASLGLTNYGGNVSITARAKGNGTVSFNMGDSVSSGAGRLRYDNATDTLTIRADETDMVTLDGTTAALVGNLAVDTDTLYVDSATDRVGIGTSSPEATVHVASGKVASDNFDLRISEFRPNIVLEDLSGSATDWQIFTDLNTLQFRYGDASTNTKLASEAMRIDASGKVGIGTATPSYKLDVQGNVGVNGVLWLLADDPVLVLNETDTLATHRILSANGTLYVQARDSDGTNDGDMALTGYLNTDLNQLTIKTSTYRIETGGAPRFYMASDGDVGIGTVTPGAKLDVRGGVNLSAVATEGRGIEIGAGRAGNGNSLIDLIGDATYSDYGLRILRADGGPDTTSYIYHRGTGALRLRAQDAGHVALDTNSTERMRVTSAGDVGIGTATPGYKLDVQGDAGVDGNLTLPAATTEARVIEIGAGRAGNGPSYIDLIGDATYGDYGLRVIRQPSGPNAGSEVAHRGTGPLRLRAQDAGYVTLETQATERMRVDSAGKVGIGKTNPTVELDVEGIVRTKVYTVATLPLPATAGPGARAMVNDATAMTFGTIVSGGGINSVPVYCTGVAWLIG